MEGMVLIMGKRKLPGQKVTIQEKNTYVALGVILVTLAVILIAILALSVPVVPVCAIVILEAGIAVCLHDVQIWLHGLVIAIQLIAGAVCGQFIFMLMCAVLYIAGLFLLRYIRGEI
jgi:hypothetical protein